MGKDKCRSCVHYQLIYSYIYNSYIEGCDLDGKIKGNGCEGTYKNKKKEPPKAFIKRRV